jgi:hypothetical protein
MKQPGGGSGKLTPERADLLAEIATAVYVAGIALAASISGFAYILFPELGALAYDVVRRPRGVWASAPGLLVATPILTGVVGTLVSHWLVYGPISVSLTVGSAMLILAVLRSPIAPAISAGLLPLTLGITSWWYPASLTVGLGSLTMLLLAWRRYMPVPDDIGTPADRRDDAVEQAPREWGWVPAYFLFLIATATVAQVSG